MGLSSKKSKTTTNQNTTATMTPTNPSWVSQGIEGLAGKIGKTFGGLDPYSLAPGPDPLQTQAGQGAAGLTTSPAYSAAQRVLRGVAGAGPQSVQSASLLDNLPAYMSPYTHDVVDTSLADFDHGAGQQMGQATLDLAGDSTFGGSGGALYKSALGGELARGRGTLSAGLHDQAFTTGASLSGQDAERRQSASLATASLAEQALARKAAAATGMAGVAGQQGDETRANVGTQANIGDILRMIQQQHNLAPITALAGETAAWNGLPLDLFKGSNATGSLSGTTTGKESGASLSDWLSAIAGTAKAAATAGAGG